MENKSRSEFENGRRGAMTFAGLVYGGVVIAATTLFISFVLTAFPRDAYFSRFIMTTAGLLVGASAFAFPVALHVWAISGWHRAITIGLYYGEMAIIALNTIASFTVLLFNYAGTALPDWVSWYEPFSIGAIVYTLIAWGTIFLTDPMHKTKAKSNEAEQKFNELVANKKMEFLQSIEGEDAITAAAWMQIQNQFMAGEPKTGGHFGSGRLPENQNTIPPRLPFVSPKPGPAQSLPASRAYTLAELLAMLDIKDPYRAVNFLANRGLDSPFKAYEWIKGYLPADMTQYNFNQLYYELWQYRQPVTVVPPGPTMPSDNGNHSIVDPTNPPRV